MFFAYLVLHGAIRFGVEATRDDSAYPLDMKVAQLVALGEVALRLALLAYFWRNKLPAIGSQRSAG